MADNNAADVTNSILNSTKKALGIDPDYDAFDPEIIMFVNSTLSVLRQIGFGPENGFAITGDTETWSEYFGDVNHNSYQTVKHYIYLKVRIAFDPPQNSFGLDALNESAKELEWRINVEYELTTEHKYENEEKVDDYVRTRLD